MSGRVSDASWLLRLLWGASFSSSECSKHTRPYCLEQFRLDLTVLCDFSPRSLFSVLHRDTLNRLLPEPTSVLDKHLWSAGYFTAIFHSEIYWLWIIGSKFVVTASYKVESVAGACTEKCCSVIRFNINFSPSPPHSCWVESARVLDRYTCTTTTIDRVNRSYS